MVCALHHRVLLATFNLARFLRGEVEIRAKRISGEGRGMAFDRSSALAGSASHLLLKAGFGGTRVRGEGEEKFV